MHLPPGLRPRVDLPAVATRYRAITATDTTEDMRRAALASALDVPRLVAEVDRLTRALVRSRLRYANLAAAARVTLTADRDGDPDPAGYLRDELTHPTPTEPPPARLHRPAQPHRPTPPSGTGPGAGAARPHRVDPRSGRSAADRAPGDRTAGDRGRR